MNDRNYQFGLCQVLMRTYYLWGYRNPLPMFMEASYAGGAFSVSFGLVNWVPRFFIVEKFFEPFDDSQWYGIGLSSVSSGRYRSRVRFPFLTPFSSSSALVEYDFVLDNRDEYYPFLVVMALSSLFRSEDKPYERTGVAVG